MHKGGYKPNNSFSSKLTHKNMTRNTQNISPACARNFVLNCKTLPQIQLDIVYVSEYYCTAGLFMNVVYQTRTDDIMKYTYCAHILN